MTGPALEKAAPIPADVLALARLASIEIGEWVVDRSRKHPRAIVADLLLADRASQEERIREDERARDDLVKLYYEYDRIPDWYTDRRRAAHKAFREAMEAAIERARLRGGAS